MEKIAADLASELKFTVKRILEDDEFALKNTDLAIQSLRSLKGLKMSWTNDVPVEFTCPLSRELMIMPAVATSGETYDRMSMEQWLEEGCCPQSKEVLLHKFMFPNVVVKDMIEQWCKDNYRDLLSTRSFEKQRLNYLLKKLCSSAIDGRKEAAKEISDRVSYSASMRSLFGDVPDAIPQMIKALSLNKDVAMEEYCITALYKICTHETSNKLLAENTDAILVIIKSLKSGNIVTRRYAAAAIFTLSSTESYKRVIGEYGALKPLIDILDQGIKVVADGSKEPEDEGSKGLVELGKDVAKGSKDLVDQSSLIVAAASAIYSLCIYPDNRSRAVADGLVPVLLRKIRDLNLVDDLLSIVAIISRHEKAVKQMIALDAVSLLLSILRDSESSECNKGDSENSECNKGDSESSECNKENVLAALCWICSADRRQLKEVNSEQYGTIQKLAEDGSSRAKRKARDLLKMISSEEDGPAEFNCPLSGKLFKDPVVIASGQTYDRSAILGHWSDMGHQRCPKTDYPFLSNKLLIPNLLLKKMIAKSQSVDEGDMLEAYSELLFIQLFKLSSLAFDDRKKAAREIRKHSPRLRTLFGDLDKFPNAIRWIVNTLKWSIDNKDLDDVQEDCITILWNISTLETNNRLLGKIPDAISLIIKSLDSPKSETRSNAAATLFTLSALDSNRRLIGNSGALRPLIRVLDQGNEAEMKNAASAISRLCDFVDNRSQAVADGVVRVLVRKIKDGTLVDDLQPILAMVCTSQNAIDEMIQHDADTLLSCILRPPSSQ